MLCTYCHDENLLVSPISRFFNECTKINITKVGWMPDSFGRTNSYWIILYIAQQIRIDQTYDSIICTIFLVLQTLSISTGGFSVSFYNCSGRPKLSINHYKFLVLLRF
jgi:hypothetical protein